MSIQDSSPATDTPRWSPVVVARVTGAFYAAVVITSLFGFAIPSKSPLHELALASNLLSGALSVIVTILLYELFKPVNRTAALMMAAFNLVGVAHSQNSLAFFGCYCLLLGYLIWNATFMPRALGAFMVLAGLGLLTNAYMKFLAPALAPHIAPYAFALDTGEIALTLWLLTVGVNEQRWLRKRLHPYQGL